jgi:hypothetical protein
MGKESGKGGNFMAFLKVKRPDVVAKYPSLKPTEISKKVGELWRALSDAEKAEYKASPKSKADGGSKKGCGCGSRSKKSKGGSDSD